MVESKKLTYSFILMLFIYTLFSLVVFNTVYKEWDYFTYNGKVFLFDILRYLFVIIFLTISIYVIGLKVDWGIILAIIVSQTIGFVLFYYFIYLSSGKVHYMGDMYSLSKVKHNSFFEWLDFLIGIKRWCYTRLIELILLSGSVYFTMRLSKPKWALINRNAYNSK